MLVIGAGGLGSPAAFYLASAGVASIALVDGDAVDLTNLQRQILHTTERVGTQKAHSGASHLRAINPEVEVTPVARRVDADALDELVRHATIVLDCSDNFATRHATNRACVMHRKAAGVRRRNPVRRSDRSVRSASRRLAVLRVSVSHQAKGEDELCSTMGVFAPLTGIIGTMQAGEALKLAAGNRHNAAWPARDARCADDAMAYRARDARPRLPGVCRPLALADERRHLNFERLARGFAKPALGESVPAAQDESQHSARHARPRQTFPATPCRRWPP